MGRFQPSIRSMTWARMLLQWHIPGHWSLHASLTLGCVQCDSLEVISAGKLFQMAPPGPCQDLNRIHWMPLFVSISRLPNLIITTTRCDRLLLKAILMSPEVPLRIQAFSFFLLLSLAKHLGSDAWPGPISYEASFCWNNYIVGPWVAAMNFHNQMQVYKEKIIDHLIILKMEEGRLLGWATASLR